MSEDLIERLRNTSNMINMGEKISWGQDTSLMDEAATEIERLRAKLAAAEKLVGELSYYVISPLRLASDKDEEERRRGLYRAAAEWMEKGDE